MTVTAEIVRLLGLRPGGMSDAALARATGEPRQRVSRRCRDLADRGVLVRDASSGVTINRLAGARRERAGGDTEWFDAGAVRSALATWLRAHRWAVAPEAAADLLALRAGTRLHLAVGGYPHGEDPDRRAVRATQRYAAALLAAVRLRGVHPDDTDAVAIGLPDFARYRVLVAETEAGLRALRIGALLVDESGAVSALAGADAT